MTAHSDRQGRPTREELGRSLIASGALSSDWLPTFSVVDRSLFLPELMWPFDMDTGRSVPVDRAEDPDAWYGYADSDIPIVTQWDDGKHRGTASGHVSTSSSSKPSVVYRLLSDLDVHPDMRVLDAGSGTGETSGALTHRQGARCVTTVEVDRAVSRRARERLCAAGLHPDVIEGDATQGYRDNAPYDRILATFGLREIPYAWIPQTRAGGLIVAPWGTHYSNADAVVRLRVGDGIATGMFGHPVEFMKARAQRRRPINHSDYIPERGVEAADTSTTPLTEEEFVTGRFSAVPFALGLRVPQCAQSVADKRQRARPVWFYGLTDRSWACVMFRDGAEATVWQSGPRRLWEEVETAYHWWVDSGRPGHDRFGLTVTPDGQHVWLDEPDNAWPL